MTIAVTGGKYLQMAKALDAQLRLSLRWSHIERGLYRGFRDTGYLPFYSQGYRILSNLLTGIWDTWFNIFVTSRDINNLGKLIMGIFAVCQFTSRDMG